MNLKNIRQKRLLRQTAGVGRSSEHLSIMGLLKKNTMVNKVNTVYLAQ